MLPRHIKKKVQEKCKEIKEREEWKQFKREDKSPGPHYSLVETWLFHNNRLIFCGSWIGYFSMWLPLNLMKLLRGYCLIQGQHIRHQCQDKWRHNVESIPLDLPLCLFLHSLLIFLFAFEEKSFLIVVGWGPPCVPLLFIWCFVEICASFFLILRFIFPLMNVWAYVSLSF